jgi:signal transduction histidine kinase
VTGWCIGLKVRQQVIGTLEVYLRADAPRYDESHLLNGLATQAAIAIENAKLYKVVREKEASLQRLVERMIQGQEEDRRRVAYDIHDGLAQLMVSAHQHMQTFGMLHRRQDPKSDQALERGLFMLQKSIEEVRKVIAGLRPSELDDFGLVAAIQLYVQALRDELGWQIDFVDEVGTDRLPAPVEVTAYRIIQEALTNSRRHGEARRARVHMKREAGWLHLEIQDWGRGFDVDQFETDTATGTTAGHHVGLHGMRERAHLLGGTFEVESQPGEGTTVRASIPFREGVDLPSGIAGYWDNAALDGGTMQSGGAVGGWPAARAALATESMDGRPSGHVGGGILGVQPEATTTEQV